MTGDGDTGQAGPAPGDTAPGAPLQVSRGRPTPLGVTAETPGAGGGPAVPAVNVAVWAPEATSVEFCVFTEGDDAGPPTEIRVPLPYRSGGIRHARVSGAGPGTRYGFRVSGAWDPVSGRYANPAKLLLDPFARIVESPVRWHPLMSAFTGNGEADRRDSASVVPRCVVASPDSGAAGPPGDVPDPASNRPGRAADHRCGDLVIYEAHVRGISAAHPDVPGELRGTYAGMACPAVVDHLRSLGVTAVELLPLQTFIDDRFLVNRGFTNYWGYQPVSWFSAEPRYATDGTGETADRELRQLVHTLHGAGLEVILDVVYNHSGEGDELGPSVSLRGLDNNGYYLMDGSGYVDVTGTGNSLATHHPQTLRMITDSLRHWVTHFGVDGFRFDLGAALGRTGPGASFDPSAAFFQTLAQDPVLSQVHLIAEPWDIGDGGYRLGQFPWPWAEWNDRFRDGVRRLWRGETPGDTDLGSLFLGSADLFSGGSYDAYDTGDPGDTGSPGGSRAGTATVNGDGTGRLSGGTAGDPARPVPRSAAASVNFLTAHDGFTLADVVSYSERHNGANGENGRDGHGENFSDNLGAEGPTDDPGILERRARRVRAMLTTLLTAQGTPMILAGDELGNSQGGNNNSYVQDNEVGWVDWAGADHALTDFTRRLTALRHRLPVLRQTAFRHGHLRADGLPDVTWYRADGAEAGHDDWHDPEHRLIAVLLRGTAGDLFGEAAAGTVLVVLNPGPDTEFTVPDNGLHVCMREDPATAASPAPGALHHPWRLEIDSARPGAGTCYADTSGAVDCPWDGTGPYPVAGQSVVVFSAP